MKFQFDSFHDFLTMAGHGPYVWSCYVITFAFMVYLTVMPSIRSRQFIRQQRRLAQRIAAAQESAASRSS